ncbi:MAG: type-F conjugative transfer system pilin assembly protein TrbC [Gammaproteobacteria bacterium]|nr:type-F conjugative transfer system pilin assembly protein TrbC [Gammaproteobacteria bacterium]
MWSGVNDIAVRYRLFFFIILMSNNCFAHSTKVFISFSMPEMSIKQWLQQAEKANAQVYLRGFVENSFKKTINRATLVIKDNSQGFLLDPKEFEKHKIEKVPAVVFVDDNQEPITVYGDMGLLPAAQLVATRAESKSAKEVIEKLT